MSFIHGRGAVVTIDGDDISAYVKKVEFEREADEHDVTCLGKNSKVFAGGLKGGSATLEGVYDDGTGGPQAVIEPLIGTVVELVYKPEGTGSGKPTKTVDVLVKGYAESSPVDEMITWTADLTLSDDVALTTQGA